VCGNESAFYPPLSKGVQATAAMAVEHSFTGKAFNETWTDAEASRALMSASSNQVTICNDLRATKDEPPKLAGPSSSLFPTPLELEERQS